MAAPTLFYAWAGVALFVMGAYGIVARAHAIKKILAMNIMGVGVFMVFVSMAQRTPLPDAVPHAMVLTGIVVAVSATAVGLALAERLFRDDDNHSKGPGL